MRLTLRPLAGLLLALLLSLTGQSMAVARGAAPPVGVMVLCTGAGPLTVLVDETGAPTGPRHLCPECALSLFDAAPGSAAALLSRAFVREAPATPVHTTAAGQTLAAPRARGPPVSV
ncbi:hypothetical protein [Marinovum sp.]|uniref:hypothetical protein n=1 Tax=Marinovum sp. TaxID=2024839 RepID=UPI002B265DD9|nr:hypothetical protein [Marinovum sp.]